MTAHELARRLLDGPDLTVTIRAYEAGVNTVRRILPPRPCGLFDGPQPYFGEYDYRAPMGTTFQAIHLDGED